MAEADTEFLEGIQIDKPYRLLGFENAEEGFDELDSELSGTLDSSSDEVKEYLRQRTEHIEDRKDHKNALKLLETRIRSLKMQQQS
ncbi:hypothetical protein IH980_05045 [Patescibacteria group bacterium]|nr:hypothetical protein [Patescibacteria group bacterium]